MAGRHREPEPADGSERPDGPDPVSELTTNRLSVYLRCLNTLAAADVRTVSSHGLADQFHLNAAQIRKDLAYFGEFGVRGVGYYVKELRRDLRQILGLDRHVAVAIMGAGNLGLALADYPGFRLEGFEIAALFDANEEKIGRRSKGACRSTTSATSGGWCNARGSASRSLPFPRPPRSRWSTRSWPPGSRPC
jgi:putative DNA-binding protein/CoA binding protein